MRYDTENIILLLKKYLEGSVSDDDNQKIQSLFREYPDLLNQINQLKNPLELEKVVAKYGFFYKHTSSVVRQDVLDTILHRIDLSERGNNRFKRYKKIAFYAAASILLIVFSFGIWILNNTSVSVQQDVITQAEQIYPGSSKATLKAADGSVIELNEDHVGIVVGDAITYRDGSILLQEPSDTHVEMTLSTPKGGQYQITLPDQTQVWLNADSRLTYPTKFSGSQRTVNLDGEAYFEVAKDELRPFIVHTSNERVEVLGTHFNVNSYKGETSSKVSLLEGQVRVQLDNGPSQILHPGQQTVVEGAHISVQNIDKDEIVAWKNGEFMFNNESLGGAMRKLERWYDIDIEVDPELRELSLWGSVSRFANFDQVLKIIKTTDDAISISIDGRRVKIMK